MNGNPDCLPSFFIYILENSDEIGGSNGMQSLLTTKLVFSPRISGLLKLKPVL